jgi:hypothetical protein
MIDLEMHLEEAARQRQERKIILGSQINHNTPSTYYHYLYCIFFFNMIPTMIPV